MHGTMALNDVTGNLGCGFYKNGGPLGGEGFELRKERRVVVLMHRTILRPWPLTDTMESTAS